LWVSDAAEAQSERTRRTRLWERCEQRHLGFSPFGIIFASTEDPPARAPFSTWTYAPSYLPPGMSMQVAEGTTLHEPELLWVPSLRRGHRDTQPVRHALPIRRVTGVGAGVPQWIELSVPSRAAEAYGLLAYFESPRHVLEISFAASADLCFDLRPDLPLVFRSTPI
jgi:hypothetical protein